MRIFFFLCVFFFFLLKTEISVNVMTNVVINYDMFGNITEILLGRKTSRRSPARSDDR